MTRFLSRRAEMDLPVGALTASFEDRMVLETRSLATCWIEGLHLLLALPFLVIPSFLLAALFWTHLPAGTSLALPGTLGVVVWGAGVAYFFQRWSTRNFHEVAIFDQRLEVTGGPGSCALAELLDVKRWPTCLELKLASGKRLKVKGLSPERKLQVLQTLTSAMARDNRSASSVGGVGGWGLC